MRKETHYKNGTSLPFKKEGHSKGGTLSSILSISHFNSPRFRNFDLENEDIFGDVYEYLLAEFAEETKKRTNLSHREKCRSGDQLASENEGKAAVINICYFGIRY
jgi:hypothetical protein